MGRIGYDVIEIRARTALCLFLDVERGRWELAQVVVAEL